jgi:pimeloyl-ACP methyl ester carboxylesterase
MNKKVIRNLSVFMSEGKGLKPIVFIHGFPYDHNMWQAQIEELSKNYFCVSYDIRGLGDSPAGDGQFTMESFVDDLETIVDEMNLDKPVLCGLSMGGYISLRAMERMQNKFSALILCDTKSTSDDNEGKLKRAAAIKLINTGKFYDFIESFVLNCFGEKFIRENNADYRKIVDRSKGNNPAGVKGCLLAMAGRTDTTESLAKIKIPTLVICGSEDKLSPPDVMKFMAEKIPNSKFVLIENSGHMSPVENPARVNKAIRDFLTENKAQFKKT